MANTILSLNDLADLIRNNKNELSEKIESLQQFVDTKFSLAFSEVKKDIATIIQRQDFVENRMDKYDRQLHLNDLLLNGIPPVQQEDLNKIFNDICTKIKYTTIQEFTPSMFRCKNDSDKPTIILKFISPTIRNKFYYQFVETSKAEPITLADIGFKSVDRVSLQESLSNLNSMIFRKAMQLKKQHKIYSVFTQNGIVKIKTVVNGKATFVTNINQLLDIEHKNITVSTKHKRKLNNSSITDGSNNIVENDPKVHKSSTPKDRKSSRSSNSLSTPSSSRSCSPNTTTILQQQTRSRKSSISSATLDEYFQRTS